MNEAAERLRPNLTFAGDELLLDAALSEERRFTVERLRKRLAVDPTRMALQVELEDILDEMERSDV